MTLEAFEALVHTSEHPVILLEGTRSTSQGDERAMQAFARALALRFPKAMFRSGNAPGSDAAFATGVAEVEAARLQLVVPYASHRAKERPQGAQVLALEAVSDTDPLLRLTLQASPIYTALAKKTSRDAQAKFTYLLRDTLKITGDAKAHFAPATVGLFFINEAKPDTGGTAHTLRVCQAQGIATATQVEWRGWDL